MRRKRGASIRMRLTLSHLAVIVVAMGLSGLLLLSLLERYFLQAMEDGLAAQAQITAQALIPGATALGTPAESPSAAYNTVQQQWSNLALEAQNVAPPEPGTSAGLDLDYLADATLQLSTQLETRIRIVDAQGIVRVDSSGGDVGVDLATDPLVNQALAGQRANRVDRESPPAMRLALPMEVEGQLVGAVYLSQPLRDALAVIGDLRTLWLLSTLAALLLSAGVGLALSGAITRPLRRLTAAAAAVARGDLGQKVPVRSRDEVGRLSQTFNEMTSRLQAARQMQVDFVANVSHELRTPLTAVKGTIETLRDGAVDDPQVRDRFLETVEGETDRLIRLVNDLLTLTRADSEALNLQREKVDLRALAQVTAGQMAARAEERGLALRVDASPAAPQAWADPDRVQQVLLNLLDNALKYSSPGGVVLVRVVRAPDGSAQVQVQDQGIGIPPQALSRIGERFYRADRARARSDGGSGLGLAIARAVVESHGGRLVIESEEGHGTRVTFTLPAA